MEEKGKANTGGEKKKRDTYFGLAASTGHTCYDGDFPAFCIGRFLGRLRRLFAWGRVLVLPLGAAGRRVGMVAVAGRGRVGGLRQGRVRSQRPAGHCAIATRTTAERRECSSVRKAERPGRLHCRRVGVDRERW